MPAAFPEQVWTHHFPDLPAWLSPQELPLLVGLVLLGILLAVTY